MLKSIAMTFQCGTGAVFAANALPGGPVVVSGAHHSSEKETRARLATAIARRLFTGSSMKKTCWSAGEQNNNLSKPKRRSNP